jgi:hypothetical protein
MEFIYSYSGLDETMCDLVDVKNISNTSKFVIVISVNTRSLHHFTNSIEYSKILIFNSRTDISYAEHECLTEIDFENDKIILIYHNTFDSKYEDIENSNVTLLVQKISVLTNPSSVIFITKHNFRYNSSLFHQADYPTLLYSKYFKNNHSKTNNLLDSNSIDSDSIDSYDVTSFLHFYRSAKQIKSYHREYFIQEFSIINDFYDETRDLSKLSCKCKICSVNYANIVCIDNYDSNVDHFTVNVCICETCLTLANYDMINNIIQPIDSFVSALSNEIYSDLVDYLKTNDITESFASIRGIINCSSFDCCINNPISSDFTCSLITSVIDFIETKNKNKKNGHVYFPCMHYNVCCDLCEKMCKAENNNCLICLNKIEFSVKLNFNKKN